MSDPLYRKELLRLAADAHGAGRLSDASVSGQAFNPACGDRVIVDLKLADGTIVAAGMETRACVLAQASASILGHTLAGRGRPEIEALHECLTQMLDAHGPAPASPFGAFAAFDGAVEYRSRHRCVLLPLEAVLDALNNQKRPSHTP